MTIDLGLLIGLLAIALAIFFGLLGFRTTVGDQLREIKDKVVSISQTVEKIWDLAIETLPQLIPARGQTVERNLQNFGRTTISARPGKASTDYLIEVEKPLLQEGFIGKVIKESGLTEEEKRLFGEITVGHILSPTKMVARVPSTDPKLCTQFMSLFLRWLDSTYFDATSKIKEFEEPILKE